jgi:type II secretory pathway pseudopilin PulG
MPRMRDERGWALVTTMIVMVVLLGIVAAMLSLTDVQRQQAGSERVKETSFNVADSAIDDEAAIIAKSWPGTAAGAFPSSCTRTSASSLCPDPTSFAQNFSGTDLDASSTWTISIRDDLGGTSAYYQKSVADGTPCPGTATAPCTWDANGDGVLWLRADGTVKGRSVSVVAQVVQAISLLPLPHNVVTAGKFATGNTGKKTIIDTKGCGAPVGLPAGQCKVTTPAPVAVRCTSTSAPPNTCTSYYPSQGQVSPDTVTTGYPGTSSLTSSQLAALRSQAYSKGTYYCGAATGCTAGAGQPGIAGCPANLSAPLIYVENFNCTVSGTTNSLAAPGALFFNSGTFSMTGNSTFYGLVYSANTNPSPTNTGNIVTLTGNAKIIGAINVDGQGGVSLGSSGYPNLVYDPTAFDNVRAATGNAMLAQNSYRVLPPGK